VVRVPRLRPVTTAQEVASQARKAREATLRRDELIRQMRAEGASLRTIALAAGLTHPAVVKILRKAPVAAL
jgi:DNA invertase Pin-like site-specific DNA recombinase